MLLIWVLIVITFFTASSGKRGVYVLPAVPALVMAAATWLPEVLRLPSTRKLAFVLAAVFFLDRSDRAQSTANATNSAIITLTNALSQ